MENLETKKEYETTPGTVGAGKQVHLIFHEKGKPGSFAICGAGTVSTGRRWSSRVRLAKGERVTCKKCKIKEAKKIQREQVNLVTDIFAAAFGQLSI